MTSEPPTSLPPNRDRSTRIVAIVCSLLVALGALASYGLSRRIDPNREPSTEPGADRGAVQSPPGETPGQTADAPTARPDDLAVTVTVYRLRDTGQRFELVSNDRDVAIATDATDGDAVPPAVRLEAALRELISGAVPDDLSNTIPAGVRIENLEIKDDGIHLDLSAEFVFGGGSASMQGRLAQVLYTATEADPTAALWLSVTGEPLTLLGGEGLIVPQPLTRAAFEANFSL